MLQNWLYRTMTKTWLTPAPPQTTNNKQGQLINQQSNQKKKKKKSDLQSEHARYANQDIWFGFQAMELLVTDAEIPPQEIHISISRDDQEKI